MKKPLRFQSGSDPIAIIFAPRRRGSPPQKEKGPVLRAVFGPHEDLIDSAQRRTAGPGVALNVIERKRFVCWASDICHVGHRLTDADKKPLICLLDRLGLLKPSASTISPAIMLAVQEQQEIIKLDGEIRDLQEKLKEFETVKARLDELQKKRWDIIEEMAKKVRQGKS